MCSVIYSDETDTNITSSFKYTPVVTQLTVGLGWPIPATALAIILDDDVCEKK